MNTLSLFALKNISIPVSASWYLADLGEFRGKQELYTRQSPQRLKALREHAMIESAVSSNRIEGVSVEPSRVRDLLVATKPLFRDRDEEEVRGYRDALKLIHESVTKLPINEVTIFKLHSLTRGQIWDAGQYKEKDGDIIERSADGRERVRFHTVSANDTPGAIAHLVQDWQNCLEERWIQPKMAYHEIAERVGDIKAPRGTKTEQILAAFNRLSAEFTLTQLEHECPGVSRDMIRRVLREQQSAGGIECQGRGPAARWIKKG